MTEPGRARLPVSATKHDRLAQQVDNVLPDMQRDKEPCARKPENQAPAIGSISMR
jgi:hypothetical protein